jgi:hypothetical protein
VHCMRYDVGRQHALSIDCGKLQVKDALFGLD